MAKDWFVNSAFSNVASKAGSTCWAGRPAVKQALIRLRRSWSRMPESTLDLMWANLGAGKTHTLLYLQACLANEDASVVSGFIEMPEQVGSFLDLYRRLVGALPLRDVAATVLASGMSPALPVVQAANVLVNGGLREQQIVRDWILGGRPLIRDLRQCSGISERIEDDVSATDIFSAICQSYSVAKRRLVLLIDEYQRVGVLKPQARDRVLSSLRTVFSRSPSKLSVVLSVHSMVEQNALQFIPPELRTLIGGRPTISLPEMDQADAEAFVFARFACFRPAGFIGGPSDPFTSQAVSSVIQFLAAEGRATLTPRQILQTLGYIFGQADDPDAGIDENEALRLASELYRNGQAS